jgi:hypothetical protein
MNDRFYLACFRDNVGGNVAFHAKDGAGYVTDISKAEIYSREAAQARWNSLREFDQPISADHVDAATIDKVDCQHIPHVSKVDDPKARYVAYYRDRWDGNDVYWLSRHDTAALSFKQAREFNHADAVIMATNDALCVLPLKLVLTVVRKTFPMVRFNARIMTQGAGIRLPEHVKRARRAKRRTSSKTRFNCPGCGKLHWQLHPHDFAGCRDNTCQYYD